MEITSCARLHSPASTILEIADSWKPDLIVMGSHGRGAIGRLFLGSVSLRVATEAHTSVRITRSAIHSGGENLRLCCLPSTVPRDRARRFISLSNAAGPRRRDCILYRSSI